MKSRPFLFLNASTGFVLLWSATALAQSPKPPPPPASAADAPAQLKPIAVSTVFLSIKVRPFYRESSTGLRLSRLMIEDVRAKSLAARAGLVAGMEILAIQGVELAGLRDTDLEKLCEAPVAGDALALKIADAPVLHGSISKPREIRIPLVKSAPETPKEISVTLDPNKRVPPAGQK